MSRTKTASKKKTAPEQKPQPEQASQKEFGQKKSEQEKSSYEKNGQAKRTSDTFGYDSLARQTLDLWREQLSHFLNNPDAMKDMNKVMEPAARMMSPQIAQMFTPLFSGGMDLWLMMLEQLGKAANMNTPTMNTKGAADKQDEKTSQRTSTQSGAENRPEDRPTATSALSGASAYAVAQLASRLADLEKRFDEYEATAKPVAKKPAAKKKPAASAVVEVKRGKQQAQK